MSEYKEFDSAYWGLGCSINGLVYFGLCTHQPNKTAGLFSFDPISQQIKKLLSLSDILPKNNISFQGKIHTSIFADKNNNLYFGSHFVYPNGIPQEVNYSGGHLFSFNTKNGKLTDCGIAFPKEGILSMTFDRDTLTIYCLTAPSGYFISFSLVTNKYTNYGQLVKEGGVCRSLVLDKDGNVYGSIEKNKIFMFNKDKQTLEILDLTLPTTRTPVSEWSSPSRGGVNKIGRNIWRAVVFNNTDSQIYGIHATSSSIFKFDPSTKRITNLDYFGPKGYEQQLDKIYPTLSLSIYKDTLLYTPVSGFFDYARSENIKDFSHLMKYTISSNKVTDEGVIENEEGRKIYGVAGSTVSANGTYYLLGAVEVFDGERYNKQNTIEGKPYHLGLISIN